MGDQTYHDLGSIRGAKIFMVQSEMGSGGPSGATLTIEEGIRLLNPSAVIMVGIAFGISEGKQHIGDILVSKQLIPYDLQRVGINSNNEYEIFLRDDRPSASHRMLQRFRAGANYWRTPPTVEFGSLLSGAKLIDNQDFRDQLLRLAPEAIGGEMEGSGLYAAAHRKKVDWIVIKAICDWADGNKYQDKKQRQQRAAENAARFTVSVLEQGGFARSEQEIAAVPQSNSAEQHPNNLKSRYQTWLSERTATFSIPGPSGVLLPTETAWTELHVLTKQEAAPQQDIEELSRRYHEWERLASRADHDGYHAKDVAEIGHWVVIAGGPGAGKSTLCRKLAHDLTDLEEVVMWVHLRAVASRIQNGMDINSALIDVATDGFGDPFDVREAFLTQADCLIADGLDECGGLVDSIAEALQRWATAHPSTRIVITSRPIGYEIKYFPEWEHYDLMPLTQDQVQISSWKLIQALASDAGAVEKQAARFQEQLKHNHVASIAARNPLLLGFLIQLSLNGEDLAQQRAGLYEQILDLWRLSRPQGRIWQVPPLDGPLAWRALEVVGWLLFSSERGPTVRSHDKLVQQLSLQLAQEMGTQPLQISATASNCLQFWYERGVLDRFQIGHKEIYTFVHATFNEYAAGRYLARLSLSEIQTWVRNKYHDARWREPILLAAGCGAIEVVVETLLEIDAKDEQVASVLLFAAAVLAESPTVPGTLTRSVIDRLIARLTSINPALAYEVAEQGVCLVKKVPSLFTSLLQPLFQHPQQWTRLSALYLALESKENIVGAEELEGFLDILTTKELQPHRRGAAFTSRGNLLFTHGWDFQNKMILLGAETLTRIRPDARTRSLLQTLYQSSFKINTGINWELRRMLSHLGWGEFIEERERERREESHLHTKMCLTASYEAGQNLLETILRLLSSPFTLTKKRSRLKALTVLLYALQIPDAPVQDWWALRHLDDIGAIEAVLSGYIEALHLDKEELAQDAAWALTELQKRDRDGTVDRSLLSLLPKFPVNPEIRKLDSLNVQVEGLIRALHHPSLIIMVGAAQLLEAVGEGREEIESLFFNSNDERLLHVIAQIAGSLWGKEARPLLMKRLDQGYIPGSWWLIEQLPSLPGEHTDQQFQQTLLRALQAEEPRIAIAAVHALQQLDISLLRGMVPALQSALLYWTEQGERAKAKSYYIADDCPTCRTEPGNAYTHVSHLTDRL